MNDNPIVILLSVGIAAYALKIWLDDYRAFKRGEPNPKGLPGATPAPVALIVFAAAISLGIVGLETWGEYLLGISSEQSTISAYFLFAMIGAGIVEEILFRGFLVIRGRGKGVLIASIVGFSLLFALVHGHFFSDSEGGLLEMDKAALWWSFILFLNSLWWYTVRFLPSNTHQSLLPCFAGHIASNIGVFAIKLSQGFVTF